MEYKAYSFDLDDNLLKLPTFIHLTDKEGKVHKFSTREFEEIRPRLEESGFRETPDSFNEFLGEEKLLEDIGNSKKAGSWKYLVDCIVKHASIFAIITARGISPAVLKKGIKFAIKRNLSQEQLNEFSKVFSETYKIPIENKSQDDLLDMYLDLCRFYPVNNREIQEKFGSKDTGELKALSFEEFRNYVTDYVKKTFGDYVIVKVGFSDDSIHHLSKMVNAILKKQGLFFYRTDDKGRNEFID